MTPLDLVRLTPSIDRTSGRPEVTIGLIDGHVVMNHPELANQHVREIPGNGIGACTQANSTACLHGTFVAGILSAKQGILGSTAITCHPWVIPVVGYDLQGRPMNHSNLGSSIGRRGLGAPGDGITSLGPKGKPLTLGGTSAATPFVAGAVALLWSEFPNASAAPI